jgi:predicted lipase
MKAQASEVSDDQIIAQAIKALRADPPYSHLVRERSKIVSELYEQFAKFSKSKIQHFRKLEQQRKFSKSDESLRHRHNESQCSYPKHVHNIDSEGCGPPGN